MHAVRAREPFIERHTAKNNDKHLLPSLGNHHLHFSKSRMSSIQATNPRVAVCLIGTRFEFMHAYNLFDSFDNMVIRALGGRDAVDIFINTDSSETESRTINELQKLFAVLSVRALDATALQNLSSDACPSGTMRYASEHVPCFPGLQHMCSSTQFLRLEACYSEIRKHERNKDFRYDWIVRVRPDSFYTSPILHSKSILNESKSILVPSASPTWGVVDWNAIVPRQNARDYFHGVAERVRTCIKTTDWDTYAPDPKQSYPENIMAFHLRSLGYQFRDPMNAQGSSTSRYVHGITATPTLVRRCGCPPDQARGNLSPGISCGEDIAKSCTFTERGE